jgi:hypothetical protein
VAAQLALVERHDLDATLRRRAPPRLPSRARCEPGRRRRRRSGAQVGRVSADDGPSKAWRSMRTSARSGELRQGYTRGHARANAGTRASRPEPGRRRQSGAASLLWRLPKLRDDERRHPGSCGARGSRGPRPAAAPQGHSKHVIAALT